MKSILVSNEVDKKLEVLRNKLGLSSNAEVIEHLLNNTIILNPDVKKALLDFQKWNQHKTLNHSIVNLLLVFCEEKYQDLERKYFS